MKVSDKSKQFITIIYLFIVSVLFLLPGSAFPQNDWLSGFYFDKWVHAGIFLLMAFLFIWTYHLFSTSQLLILLLLLAAYGFIVEVIQDQFVKNRSMDMKDWVADVAGSLLGIWLARRYIKK